VPEVLQRAGQTQLGQRPSAEVLAGRALPGRVSLGMARIHTRTGDEGMTSLIGGDRVAKDHPRVEVCGELDELNSLVGLARAVLREMPPSPEGDISWRAVAEAILRSVQDRLFKLGAQLAMPPAAGRGPRSRLVAADIGELESAIDRLDGELPPLRNFILPDGCRASAQLHLARAVCRRAERVCVRHRVELGLEPEGLQYLNRLADLLFTLARWVNRRAGGPEELWNGAGGGKSRMPDCAAGAGGGNSAPGRSIRMTGGTGSKRRRREHKGE